MLSLCGTVRRHRQASTPSPSRRSNWGDPVAYRGINRFNLRGTQHARKARVKHVLLAPSFVQDNFAIVQDWTFADTGTATSPANVTLTLGGATTAGNKLLMAVNSDATVATPAGWTLIVSSIHNAGCYLFAKKTLGGETAFTVTPGSAASTCVGVAEYDGFIGATIATAQDQTQTNGSATGAATRSTGTTATTTLADEYAIAIWGYSASQVIYVNGGANKCSAQTNSFVEKGDVGTTKTTGTNVGLCVAVKTLTATGTAESTATTANSPPAESVIATFKIQPGTSAGTGNAENVTGTGGPDDAGVSVGVLAENVTGTGAALDATTLEVFGVEAVTGTGAALDAGVSVGVLAENVTGTGAALDAVVSIGALAELVSGTGSALDPYVDAVGVATGTGAALDAFVSIGVLAENVTGTGTALDATVSTASLTNAPAELVSGTGAALDPYVAAVGLATGTGAALDAATALGATAELVSDTGSALDPYVAAVEVATGSGSALDATVSTVTATNAPAECVP